MSTFLLVHGAFHSGRSWDRVVPLLEAAGHRVFAPSLTGYGDRRHLLGPEVGLDTHVDDVVTLVTGKDLTDVVLVGHSYAAAVITAAAHRMPERIAHLLYVDATVPENGQAAVDVLPGLSNMIDEVMTSENPWRIPAPPPGMFGVTDPADAAWLAMILSDHPIRTLQQPAQLGNPDADAIPRTHIRCSAVNAEGLTLPPVPPYQPNGSPSRVWRLATGHDCMITEPARLSTLILATLAGPEHGMSSYRDIEN
jgi:pimeloyl-ACP methyl ester carboxylesterase